MEAIVASGGPSAFTRPRWGRRLSRAGVSALLNAVLLFSAPSHVLSGYVITTQDGQTFQTAAYWYEGEEIRFVVAGGIVGLPRTSVKWIQARTGSEGRTQGHLTILEPKEAPEAKHPSSSSEGAVATPGTSTRRPLDPAFIAEVEAFKVRTQAVDHLSKEGLRALAEEGVALRERIRASGQEYYQHPAMLALYEVLQQLESALHRNS